MRNASTALKNYLAAIAVGGVGAAFLSADLFTFSLVDSTVYYYTSWDRVIVYGGHSFLPLDLVNNGPGISRVKVRSAIGLEVATITIDIIAPPTVQVSGATPILKAIVNGLFDGATVSMDRLIMPTLGDQSLGTYNVFAGTVADVQEAGRTHARFTVRAITEALNLYYPRNLYQPGCRHTLFDAGCGIAASSFFVNNAVTSGSNTQTINSTLSQSGPIAPPTVPILSYTTPSSGNNLIATTYFVVITYVGGTGESTYSVEASLAVPAKAVLHIASPGSVSGATGWNAYVGVTAGGAQRQNAAVNALGTPWIEPNSGLRVGPPPPPLPTGGWFTQGRVTFTSGVNAGVQRRVDQYFAGGSFIVIPLLPFTPGIGDTFTIYPGCDKQVPTCQVKFNNLIHFGGEPFTPQPESVI